MALKDNILTPEVKANGYGAVDKDRLAKAIDQIALTRRCTWEITSLRERIRPTITSRM